MKAKLLVTCALAATATAFAASAPLNDAVAVWNFGDPKDSSLIARGDVKLGVALAGDERAASLARGGDGRVAQFNGGWLEIAGPAFDPPGAEFTLLLRVRDPQGAWNAPLFGSYGGDGRASLYLRGVDGATLPFEDRNYTGGKMSTPAMWMFGWPEGPRAIHRSRGVVEFMWGATNLPVPFEQRKMLPKNVPADEIPPLFSDASNAVLRVMFPIELVGPRDWHDVIVRGTGPRLQLWIDGVLLDEEFPIGTTRRATVPRFFGAAQLADGKLLSGFHGQMDHAALWHRALSDAEIAVLSGGAKLAKQRELAVLGATPERMQYYRPRGHNLKPGDCIPWFHDGMFHLFYLNLRRNMHSKWDGGHGALEIEHASSRDLKTWQHHPVVAPISEQWEAWNGTGAAVFHDGKYWMFYPTPDYYGTNGGIQLVTSPDGEQWTKQKPHPFLPGGDCEIFPDPDPQKKLFHMIKVGKTFGGALPELKDKTLVAWVSPADLDQHGAGVMTIEGKGASFDSLVLGECAPRRWMAGSENLRRTQRGQQQNAPETAKPGEWVQIAAVYAGKTVTLYRNSTRYARYDVAEPMHFAAGSQVILGLRHLDRRDEPKAHFRGEIADARVYKTALTDAQIAELRPHEAAGPKPLVWFDFKTGGTTDRAGTLAPAELEGGAAVRDGKLVLGGEKDCLVSAGRKTALAHWVSEDLKTWKELPEPFLVADESMHAATCPNWFQWNGWYYFLGGGGNIWTSRQPYGPWKRQEHDHIDSLAVPKVGAFTGNRRIYAGWMADNGFGGNLVLRDLVQFDDGALGTRFVPEMIPPTGDPIALKQSERNARIESKQGRRQFLLDNVPNDARITLTLEPQGTVKAFGIRLRTTDGEKDGSDFRIEPRTARASYSHSTHSGSGGPLMGGPSIGGLRGLDKPVRLDVICRHDVVDVEVDGRHTLANHFWNPDGNRLGVWVEDGALLVRDVTIRPLTDRYEPYPGWRKARQVNNPLALNFHLMHPGGESLPGDPNAAFYLDGVYHLHYILAHQWKEKKSFSFVHVTSPDMLHWTWQTTKLQPSFTGHGMFSGTGFITKEGKPAAIYHGQASGRNQIAIAKDRRLSAWEKPYPVEVKNADGTEAKIRHWDPDCFLIGDTYYAISGGVNPPLFKSKDLKNWTLVGDFLCRDLPDVAHGEDISCGNFFPIGDKWMLLCISHPLGCRYYIGDWDAKAEQFVPQKHGRMNWRREDQSLFGPPWRVDFFAPESLLTPDGRRVMWAWLASIGMNDGKMDNRTIQSLPRELSLPADGILRIKPLCELESLRHSPVTLNDIKVTETTRAVLPDRAPAGKKIATLSGDAVEMRITIAREEAARKLFGFTLFSDGKGGGLPIMFRPETGALRVGTTEAPFSIADLPAGEDVQLRIFVDKYLVEVFANDRQALVASHANYRGKPDVTAFTIGAPTTIKKLELWRLKSTNQGFREAQANCLWEPDTK
jgi:sucrose-6-phosphate hydrolase SacC (GH32 family)